MKKMCYVSAGILSVLMLCSCSSNTANEQIVSLTETVEATAAVTERITSETPTNSTAKPEATKRHLWAILPNPLNTVRMYRS